MPQTSKIIANGIEIGVIENNDVENTYISLTDIAKYKDFEDPRIVITNWMSSYSTIDFLAVWEEIHNPDFNRLEFQSVRNERGRLVMTPKQWIERMQAKGIISKAGKYGGTYAHSDIAFEFASWITPEFKLYILKDYQRLKKDEAERLSTGWDEKRALSKVNYHIHTDAIQKFLLEDNSTSNEKKYTFSSEADMLNIALFGKKAWQWREEHPEESKRGENIRDYATAEELIILVNMESQNAEMIKDGLSQQERYDKLRDMVRRQMQVLLNVKAKDKLSKANPRLLKGGDNNAD